MTRFWATAAVVAAALAMTCHNTKVLAAEDTVRISIVAQPLADALNAWAQQTGYQLMVADDTVQAHASVTPLQGSFTPQEALRRLLQGTGLTFTLVNPRTIQVSQAPSSSTGSESTPSGQKEAAEVGEGRTPRFSPETRRYVGPVSEEIIAEVITTGSHIRGATVSASPVLVFNRADIEQSGLSSAQEFIQRLPQNFNGDAAEPTLFNQGGQTGGNTVGANGVNLRGVGSSSTLVLINGRRIAPVSRDGNIIDASLVPLSAIERVEIVPDGASATYGADAVGGVTNFILRKDSSKPETRARFGRVTTGDSEDKQFSQSAGFDWKDGSALFNYAYRERTPLDANDRPYAQGAPDPFTVLGGQEQHGVLTTINQRIRETVDLYADAFYASRDYTRDLSLGSASQRLLADIEAVSGSFGAGVVLPRNARLEVTAGYSRSRSDGATSDIDTNVLLANIKVDTSVWSLDTKIDGPLVELPLGTIQYALGMQYRGEEFEHQNLLQTSRNFKNDRDVGAGYVELRVPLLKGSTLREPSLELTLADRYEDYSDFGTTNNGKVGLVWRALPGINIRGSYGTSFKAPFLNDLNDRPSQVAISQLFDPTVGANREVMIVFGGNPALEPEVATNWSVGFDLRADWLSGFKASMTYYRIDYEDRIQSPQTSVATSDILRREQFLGPEIVRRNPPLPEVQAYSSEPGFGNPRGVPLTSVTALADYRLRNLASLITSGVDVSFSLQLPTTFGDFETGIDGTYISTYDSRLSPLSPGDSLLDTPYNPVNLRARGRLSFKRGNAGVGVFLNYTDRYADDRVTPAVPVDSWTTADITLSYQWDSEYSMLDGLSARLSAINISDEDPPFVANSRFLIHFDGSNANALGRFIALQFSKTW